MKLRIRVETAPSPTPNLSKPANYLSTQNDTCENALNTPTFEEILEPQRNSDDASEAGQTGSRAAANFPIESIYGVGSRYSQALRGIGLETIGDVAGITDIDEFEELLGIPIAVLRKIRLRALSYVSGKILQTESIEFPGDRLIYIDIETDERCRKVWLIGLLVDGRFTQFYAEKWDDERHILERFLGFLGTHRGYTLVSYSGTGFDYRVTLKALNRLGLDSSTLEEFPHVDLCTMLRRCFIFPQSSYALKELGPYLSYGFKQSDLDGLQVARAYQRHVDYGAPLEPRFFEYNEDDVRAVQHLIERCFRLRSRSEKAHLPQLDYGGGWVYIKMKLDPWLDPRSHPEPRLRARS
ncbi:MAG: ribonuclease H-like domain-containing protein [Candidatus Bathyarchaeia archaeon]